MFVRLFEYWKMADQEMGLIADVLSTELIDYKVK